MGHTSRGRWLVGRLSHDRKRVLDFPQLSDQGWEEGLVEDATGKPLSIQGIWSMSFANSATPNSYDPDEAPAAELYFTAGPNQGTGGLFGYLIPVSTELVQGNSQ